MATVAIVSHALTLAISYMRNSFGSPVVTVAAFHAQLVCVCVVIHLDQRGGPGEGSRRISFVLALSRYFFFSDIVFARVSGARLRRVHSSEQSNRMARMQRIGLLRAIFARGSLGSARRSDVKSNLPDAVLVSFLRRALVPILRSKVKRGKRRWDASLNRMPIHVRRFIALRALLHDLFVVSGSGSAWAR